MNDTSPQAPQGLDGASGFIASEEDAGKRLDAVIAAKLEGLSRNRVQALIKGGEVQVNGKTVEEPKHKVHEGDHLSLTMPEPEDPEPQGEDIPLDIVYEDDALIVIDKPAGLVVHPGAGNWTGTLVNALIAHCGDSLSGIGGVKRPGIVHRLDKDTSGLLVVAKTDIAHQGLSEQFADHGRTGPLERAYLALVWGGPGALRGTIEANLARSESNRQKMTVVRKGGREAITHWQVIERFGPVDQPPLASLMECRLETGRTHQIRVHMAHIGLPLIGDQVYGAGFKTKANPLPEPLRSAVVEFPRQALHAGVLAFEHPVNGETLYFESGMPEDFATLLEALRKF
ncbi:RluA family pseudouridine synthase [Pannonibacter sp. Pt2]|uniref:Pseudouridine synthase n=1 Tax=Pannonibacter anstelovis TaxID=3121537 RepID=A0ABU7ZNF4_9HYPH